MALKELKSLIEKAIEYHGEDSEVYVDSQKDLAIRSKEQPNSSCFIGVNDGISNL